MNCEKVSEIIIEWLKDYSKKSNTNGFVVGVSGGVDSGLVSTLCAKTGIKTVLVEMPIKRKLGPISERSNKHCIWLKNNHSNVEMYERDLSKMFDEFISAHPDISSLAIANVGSRLRMCSLYSFSNTMGLIVAGTGNKIEDAGLGFFCLGGDGCVDISPIGDLMKSEVRELAKFLGVSDDIVNATPTDELWADSRSDEEQIGASYDELEWAMKYSDQFKDNLGPAMTSSRQTAVLGIYLDRHNKNAHKMKMPEVCIIPEEMK